MKYAYDVTLDPYKKDLITSDATSTHTHQDNGQHPEIISSNTPCTLSEAKFSLLTTLTKYVNN